MQDQDKFKTELIEELASLRRQVAELQELDRLRREMQERLWQSEEEFRDLFENAPVGYMELDTEGRITKVNRSLLTLFGYTAAELLGRDAAQLTTEPGISRESIAARITEAHPIVSLDRTFIRKDGTTFRGLIESRLLRDADGRVRRLRSTLQDITARLEKREALQRSEAEFRDLYDNAPIGYVEVNLEGRITRVNASELLMLGHTEEEMSGRYIWDFVKEREEHRSWILARTRGVQPLVSVERTYLRKDGAEVPVLVQNRQVRDMEGRVVGLRSAVQDISERKRAEEQLRQALVREQRHEAARKMLLVLMHEVYNPLTGILGNLSLLGTQELPPDARQCLEEIQRCAQRIHSVLNELAKLNLTEPSRITGV